MKLPSASCPISISRIDMSLVVSIIDFVRMLRYVYALSASTYVRTNIVSEFLMKSVDVWDTMQDTVNNQGI